MPTDPDAVYRMLVDANPWWESGQVDEYLAPRYRRREFFVLRDEYRSRPIVALGGPRQVGKTTVQYQLIRDLLARGTDPHRILFVSFDLPGLSIVSDDWLNDCLNVFADRVVGAPLRSATSPVYVFVDEATRWPRWHRDLKGWFDLRLPIKFFVTSSSITELRAGSAQSLTGRVSTHLLLTWKFVDVLMFRTGEEAWNDRALRLREAFSLSLARRSSVPYFDRLRQMQRSVVAGRSSLRSSLDHYLLVDGFPELVASKDIPRAARRLREYLDLTLANDLYRFYQVRSSGVLEGLLSFVARESGQLLSHRSLAESLGVEPRTVVEYLGSLEGVYFVAQSAYFSESRAKRLRRQRKAYVPNPAIRHTALGGVRRAALTDPAALGPVVEGVVLDHAKRLAYGLEPGPDPEAFYWRDRQGHEVDIVLRIRNEVVPIEVKYRTNPRRDLEGLRAFLEEEPEIPFGIVVTRDVLARDDRLLFVPLAEFLLTA